jgi:hypothetical protein
VASVTLSTELTPEHLATFQARFRELFELRESYKNTSAILRRAAKLAAASGAIDDDKPIAQARKALLTEMRKPSDVILHPDRLATKLRPCIEKLEAAYVAGYGSAVHRLSDVQARMEEKVGQVRETQECSVLRDMAPELAEADSASNALESALQDVPDAILAKNQSRQDIEEQVRKHIVLKAPDHSDIAYAHAVKETQFRAGLLSVINGCAADSFEPFADFLLSPPAQAAFSSVSSKMPGLDALRAAVDAKGVLTCLSALTSAERKQLAKAIHHAFGNKSPKRVKIGDFSPKSTTIFEKEDIKQAAADFEDYLTRQWEDGKYLRLE